MSATEGEGGRPKGGCKSGSKSSYWRLQKWLGGDFWRVHPGWRAVYGGQKRLAGLTVTAEKRGVRSSLPPFFQAQASAPPTPFENVSLCVQHVAWNYSVLFPFLFLFKRVLLIVLRHEIADRDW